MPNNRSMGTAKGLAEDVLGRPLMRDVWSGNYDKVLPISLQNFDMSAVLPAMFYMFRWGHRRGKGNFTPTYGGTEGTVAERRGLATIAHISERLAETEYFEGFGNDADSTQHAILGDLLLCYGLENVKKSEGRDKQVQRATPAHYMSSWIDLPDSAGHLRYAPEMLVAMLSDQPGQVVEADQTDRKTFFSIGRRINENVLIRPFYQGMSIEGFASDLATSDRFSEETPIDIDQLLIVRLARQLRSAPSKPNGQRNFEISNQRPIAELAAQHFSEDLRNFIGAYGAQIPRQSFVELLETGMAIGLTTIVSSVVNILNQWMIDGKVIPKHEQEPIPIFVDCSSGSDRQLRLLAEQSMDDVMRKSEDFSKTLMTMRLLDHHATYSPALKGLQPDKTPYATEWINLLGDILKDSHPAAHQIFNDLSIKAAQLEALMKDDFPEAAAILSNDRIEPNPVLRFAETLTHLQGKGATYGSVNKLWDSVLMTGQPNGLASKRRKVTRTTNTKSGRTSRDSRSFIFTESVLDYLVHLHALQNGKLAGDRPKSFKRFITELRDRHGLCIDEFPSGSSISNELLQRNRIFLERRLRDLGLLVGVNDAETMKNLRPRFQQPKVD